MEITGGQMPALKDSSEVVVDQLVYSVTGNTCRES